MSIIRTSIVEVAAEDFFWGFRALGVVVPYSPVALRWIKR
jgi:hypothetical protein